MNAAFAEDCQVLKDAKQQHKTLDFTQNAAIWSDLRKRKKNT